MVLILLLTGGALMAQESYRKFRFSVLADPHLNWLHTDAVGVDPGKIQPGIGAGLRMEHFFQPQYAFSWGVQFNATGGSLVYQDTLFLNRITGPDTLMPGSTLRHRLQYVEIPFALRLMTQQIGYTTFFAEFGLDPWINTRALIDSKESGIVKDPYEHEVAAFNLAYHCGLGVFYSLSPNLTLIIGLNYKNTFLDLTRDAGFRSPDNVRVNQAGLTIGILF